MSGGGALWGKFDEAGNEAGFKAAVEAWRQSKATPEPVKAAQRPESEASFQVGDEVEVRDYEDQTWNPGVVTWTEPLKVQPFGKQKSFTFEMVQKRCNAGT
eukprot:CAMPEP_0197660260 /NCGR_PEP_ID=MMETSP1338-20131121/50745_1 /TAXON_ID=43686 ORGANISM="Pelagodinium beii, Strain RCC1491" /NCGR_SAMPLE_ID=MMETSP1338 /ASSEMBLY_ACC=CAM_ASM_000754 /LENGTH=100 /DNA_ID=CAMNT_0043237585 /DNA_START=68 /DNA_END=370 /DNA_ORIENTATION=-